MYGNPDRVLIAVPEHVTHVGPEDGSECSLCKFYRTGYWSAVDNMLDDSRRQYNRGKEQGKFEANYLAKRSGDDVVQFFASCIALGILLGVLLRLIADKRDREQSDTSR